MLSQVDRGRQRAVAEPPSSFVCNAVDGSRLLLMSTDPVSNTVAERTSE